MKTKQRRPKTLDSTDNKLFFSSSSSSSTTQKQPNKKRSTTTTTFTTLSSSFRQTKRNHLTSTTTTNSNNALKTCPHSTETLIIVPKNDHQKTLKWEPLLNIGKSELFLPLTFPTGQTFRWKQTGLLQYTGVVDSHLISLKHHHHHQQIDNGNDDVAYFFVHSTTDDKDKVKAMAALEDYLNVGISLRDMWESFSASDPRFADLALHLGGARVLRQDPFECLIQFLCSSNNNIGRITRMVDFISSLGNYLGTVEGFQFHQFPSLERLSLVSEDELRAAGFGYRAKYIVGTVMALQSKPGGGAAWLTSLRGFDLHEAVEALCTLPGVGPKVAACIALFSLDQHHAVPVDTHVWQIATRYLVPELAGARLTPNLCSRVAGAFVNKYGKYAGWAQTLLFIAELPSQRALLPTHLGTVEVIKSASGEEGEAGAFYGAAALKVLAKDAEHAESFAFLFDNSRVVVVAARWWWRSGGEGGRGGVVMEVVRKVVVVVAWWGGGSDVVVGSGGGGEVVMMVVVVLEERWWWSWQRCDGGGVVVVMVVD
ncbi:HhH-GPD domain [Macleaya cordata]|uniref:DNA-(apurinic or apyrimidinic site) lyase n=1 Tax=Macleaya cordata TaxID=56857 RepID=A0A200Q471_MACCD|nr:HhH-GPD domain [Macleaya cordata]